MIKRIVAAALAAALCCSVQAKERKAVVIIADGIPNDVIERLHVPSIYDIASHGAYGPSYVGGEVGSYTETPTISAVCYNIMLTGTWAYKHNVWGNHDMKPDHNYWSIPRIAKENGRTVGIFSSWTDNRTVLLGDVDVDYRADGYDLDKVNYPDRPRGMQIFDYDERASEEAAACIRENAPDFSWVYLWFTDQAGHLEGNSAFFDDYVLKAGYQIQRIWDAVKYREKNFDEEWMIMVITDHGRTRDGYSHGKQSARERLTWIAMNCKPNARFRDGEVAHTDINPTVCEFLGLQVPEEVRRERDGISFIGNTIIKDLTLYPYENKEVTLRWTAVRRNDPITIYAAMANDYKDTGREEWVKVAQIKSGIGEYRIVLDSLGKSDFYKFSVESSHETLNRWLKN